MRQSPPVPAGKIQEMRWIKAPFKNIAKEADASTSAIHNVFEKEPKELVRPRRATHSDSAAEAGLSETVKH